MLPIGARTDELHVDCLSADVATCRFGADSES